MRRILSLIVILFLPVFASAKFVRDTVKTRQNDQIILTYEIIVDGENVTIKMAGKPRIIPRENLRKVCKGDLDLLKVVLFDRVGDFGQVKWNGIAPKAFTVPSGFSYNKSDEGFYILGETTTPISFTKKMADKKDILFPLYVGVYEKKHTYKLVSSGSRPLKISVGKAQARAIPKTRASVETERIAIQSREEIEADNDEVVRALSSMQMVRQLLASENEIPFSQTLQMEIYNLRSLKDRVKNPEVVEKINEVIMLCNDKERELKESGKQAALASQAQEQALIAQQKAEEEARQKEADEKVRAQEEKQQKRTIWMIIGGAALAFIGFLGNAVFKHFRDIRNQKNIMEMQASLARQAEHEAARRSRELIRNKAHQVANKSRSKMRESIVTAGKSKKNTKIKSI